jgi:hypothetical protein
VLVFGVSLPLQLLITGLAAVAALVFSKAGFERA